MNLDQAKEKIKEGAHVTAHHWDLCKVIRKSDVSDNDYILDTDLTDVIIESCENRICDCSIGIFRPTKEDELAEDYVIVV